MKKSIRSLVAVCAAASSAVGLAALPTSAASAASSPIKIALITSTDRGGLSRSTRRRPRASSERSPPRTQRAGSTATDRHRGLRRPVESVDGGHRGADRHQRRRRRHRERLVALLHRCEVRPAGRHPGDRRNFDGPEWGTQPYTNMFASDTGSVNPSFPINSTAYGVFLKSHGGTNLGTFGYGISPQSTYATYNAAKSAKLAKMKVGVADASVVLRLATTSRPRPLRRSQQGSTR